LLSHSAISVVAKFATTAAGGKQYQVDYYNPDVIVSVVFLLAEDGTMIKFGISEFSIKRTNFYCLTSRVNSSFGFFLQSLIHFLHLALSGKNRSHLYFQTRK